MLSLSSHGLLMLAGAACEAAPASFILPPVYGIHAIFIKYTCDFINILALLNVPNSASPRCAAEFRCRPAAGTPKMHPISAVARFGRMTFKELI
jgi:hypothetical protein